MKDNTEIFGLMNQNDGGNGGRTGERREFAPQSSSEQGELEMRISHGVER